MRRLPHSPSFIVLLFGLLLVLSACSDKPEEAQEKLKEKGIAFSESSFIEQIKKGAKKDIIQLFLTGGMTPAAKNKEGVNALMAAADSTPLLSLLLGQETGIAEAIAATDHTGASALLHAASAGNEENVELLLKAGANPLQSDKAGNLPLHKAIEANRPDMVESLLDASEKEDALRSEQQKSVNKRDGSLEPPLVRAAKLESSVIVESLLDHRALVNYGTPGSFTPLMAAAQKGNLDMVKLLLGYKAKVDIEESGTQATALTYAIRGGQLPVVEALVEAGADPDHLAKGRHPLQEAIALTPPNIPIFDYIYSKSKQASNFGPILLYDAAASGNKQVVASLLQHKNKLNPNMRGQVGETPLSIALANGHVEVAMLLIEHGAKDDDKRRRGPSMVEMAMKSDNIDLLSKLLEYGTDPNIKTKEGYTLAEVAAKRGLPGNLDLLLSKGAKIDKNKALIEAVMNGNSGVVTVLLKHGAKPDLRNEDGDTVLWVAAATDQAEAVLGLMNAKANPELTNNKQPGMTPLSIAAYSGNLESVRVLVEKGANLESKDESGRTPLLYAIIQLKTDVVRYLLAHNASLDAKDKLGRNARKLTDQLPKGKARDEILAAIKEAETAPPLNQTSPAP